MSEPGTELSRLLKEVGSEAEECNECSHWVRKMNNWGPKYCRIHRKHIVARLKEAASESSWSTVFTAAGGLITKPWFSIRDPFGSIVDEAIRRAEANTPSAPPPESR